MAFLPQRDRELPLVGFLSVHNRRNRARYINHSCRPNAEVYFVGHVIKIRAIKNIKPDTELTYHYGRDYIDTFIKPIGCRCLACAKK